jgi:NAD(P)-dependent dehydrogenase (short-subunit alcohol dehydrogenase family)
VLTANTIYGLADRVVDELRRALGIEKAARGVRVNSAARGYVETPVALEYGNPIRAPEAEKRRSYAVHPPRRTGAARRSGVDGGLSRVGRAPFITGATIVIDGGRSVLYHDRLLKSAVRTGRRTGRKK